ncbi:MAG: hypothetical protein HRT44_06020 [Bdellovibrionales bacterium]|nr:hypothetical protein [Bdellovibrionales bacterium]NQZ18799.1 hypothetical protein [Bdellovibrionales bacterium]
MEPHQVERLRKNIQDNPENVNSRRFLARFYSEKGDWNEVVYILSPVAERLPSKELKLLVKANLNTNKVRQAENIVRIPLSQKYVSVDTYLLATEVYAFKARNSTDPLVTVPATKELFKYIKTAQETYPSSYRVYETWISFLEEFVPHSAFEALKVLDDMVAAKVKLKPKHYSLYCKFSYKAGFTKQSKKMCVTALEKDPSNPANLIYLGQTHMNTGDKAEGMRMLASVGNKFSDSEEALWATANAHYGEKNLQEAYTFYKKAMNHEDAQPRDYLGYAKVAFELKKYKESLAAFDKHCRITKVLDHEFRRSSGLLKNSPRWRQRFRNKMMNCQKK